VEVVMHNGLALALLLALSSTACGPRFVKGTEIEYSGERQALADMVERYRTALVQRDADVLAAMASKQYFENGSSTSDPADDYNYEGLLKVLADLKDSVKAVRYSIQIRAIEIYGDSATVDYEYESQYQYAAGADHERWANKSDKNRLTFRREGGDWRIISGM
jgi:hypothetical protein